jgi:hypothetical protein
LSKKPEQRYATAAEFERAFAAAMPRPATVVTAAPPPTAPPPTPSAPAEYSVLATAENPALIVYLLDISGSMGDVLGNSTRLQVVKDALRDTVRQMVGRSTKGMLVSPRYRVAVLGYSDRVYDLFLGQPYDASRGDGVKLIDEIARDELIDKLDLSALKTTNTAAAFAAAEEILRRELPNLQNSPAPLVCHLTDGMYTQETVDPAPIALRIKALRVPDGNVLIENVFISDAVLPQPVASIREWRGISRTAILQDHYADTLRDLSSTLPESWRLALKEHGYQLDPGVAMLLPGTSTELVRLAFQMSGLTGNTAG